LSKIPEVFSVGIPQKLAFRLGLGGIESAYAVWLLRIDTKRDKSMGILGSASSRPEVGFSPGGKI
jgi:hypothetical protein